MLKPFTQTLFPGGPETNADMLLDLRSATHGHPSKDPLGAVIEMADDRHEQMLSMEAATALSSPTMVMQILRALARNASIDQSELAAHTLPLISNFRIGIWSMAAMAGMHYEGVVDARDDIPKVRISDDEFFGASQEARGFRNHPLMETHGVLVGAVHEATGGVIPLKGDFEDMGRIALLSGLRWGYAVERAHEELQVVAEAEAVLA